MTRIRSLTPGRYRALLAVLLAGLLANTAAQACTSAHAGSLTTIRIEAWDDTAADVIVSPWTHTGNANYLQGCSSSQVIPITATASIPGLEFVRSVYVDGTPYPAFGLRGRPNTPLLVFRYMAGNGSGTSHYFALDIRTPLQFSGAGLSGGSRWSFVAVAAISRGGVMEAMPTPIVGDIVFSSSLFPSLVKTDNYSVTATLKTKTCTFTDAPVTLQDVTAADLPATGSTAGDKDFNVAMRCNGIFPLHLTLTDANAPGNTGNRLTPTRNASAGAVRVQLLKEGAPVVLGQRWTLPQTQNGNQNLPLAARYYREAGTLHGGVVEGQAIITASYR